MNSRTLHRLFSRGKNHFSPFLLGAIAIATLAGTVFLALPARKAQAQRTEPTEKFRRMKNAIPGQYIVVLKDDQVLPSRVDAAATELSRRFGGRLKITWQSAIRGFVVQETTELAAINVSNDPRVDYVTEDAKYKAASATQPNPPNWGLDRIDQRDLPLNTAYNYTNTGTGVKAYIIDSGINFTHQDFGGRAIQGYDYFPEDHNNVSQNLGRDLWTSGHGTGVAGVLGGTSYGVAKGVTLVSVRVLDYSGYVSIASLVSGIDWATADRLANPTTPAVANISINYWEPGNPGINHHPINTAVRNLIAAGVTCVVSAGNHEEDAQNTSPGGQVEEAITVGASTKLDARASYSSFGPRVDLYAPGGDSPPNTDCSSPLNRCIALIGRLSNTHTWLGAGTSFAAPHVAGMATLYLQSNPTAPPFQVLSAILAKSTPDKITGNMSGTPNSLLFVDHLNTVSHAVTVNAASYKATTLAPDSRVAAFGTNLATTTVVASGNTAPTSLGGTTVKVKDILGIERLAPITFVSPNQVNYIIPNGTNYGSAIITITNSNQISSLGGAQISWIGPGVFSVNGSGSGIASGYILRIKPNGAVSYESIAQWNSSLQQWVFVPISLGPPGDHVYLIQYATGVRYSYYQACSSLINGVYVPVTGVSPEGGGATPGLDQINSGLIPSSLMGAGVVNVVGYVSGRPSNTVQIKIQ